MSDDYQGDDIFDDVVCVLQNAEEAGGPEGIHYDHLMLRVMKLCAQRLDAARANRGMCVETALCWERRGKLVYEILTGPHRGVVFYPDDLPDRDDCGTEVRVIFHPDAQHARQVPTMEDVSL